MRPTQVSVWGIASEIAESKHRDSADQKTVLILIETCFRVFEMNALDTLRVTELVELLATCNDVESLATSSLALRAAQVVHKERSEIYKRMVS